MSPLEQHLSVAAHYSQGEEKTNHGYWHFTQGPAFLGPCNILLNDFGQLPSPVTPQLLGEVPGNLPDSAPVSKLNCSLCDWGIPYVHQSRFMFCFVFNLLSFQLEMTAVQAGVKKEIKKF